jgi:two-component system chemotaxis response regulator CheB
MDTQKKIRLFIVDDSLTAREALCGIFSKASDITVIGTASNGKDAIEMAKKLRPDVITMDIQMPGLNGYQTTEEILSFMPVPIVIVSTFFNNHDTVFRTMQAGAVAAVEKPGFIKDPSFNNKAEYLISTVRNMSEVKIIRHTKIKYNMLKKSSVTSTHAFIPQIAAVGISTGGPPLLSKMLVHLKPLPFPLCIIQHIASGFSESFANWLQEFSKMPVNIMQNNADTLPGNIYIAPGGYLSSFAGKGIFAVSPNILNEQPNPSIDTFFNSINQFYGRSIIAILMTGMGRDGAIALKKLKDSGAQTIIQDKASSTIYGMPGEAHKLNAEKCIMTPEEIILYLNSFVV